MTVGGLTKQDVQRLLSDPSGEARAEMAAKIASDFDAKILGQREREVAEGIFRIMVEDAEVRVRQALSDNLKSNPDLPHDVAVSLAEDVDSVALPVLEFTTVLDDSDLVAIVLKQGTAKQIAIARRQDVSGVVSDALIDTGNESAVAALISNDSVMLSEPALLRVVNTYDESDRVQSAMVRRPDLPVTVSEKLLAVVSERLKEELAKRQELPSGVATDLILRARERATIVLSTESEETDVEALVAQMKKSGRLSPSIILRAACMGDITFMEASLAVLTGAPLVNARKLIHDSGPLGLKAIYDKAGLPESHFSVVGAAVEMAEEMEYDGREFDRERYSRRLIERVLTQYGDLGVSCEADDLEYLLTKMADLPSEVSVKKDAA